MCRVNNFMGCISLDLFGLFIGWFYMILLIIGAFVSIMGIVVFIIEQNGPGIVACIAVLAVTFLIAYTCRQLIRGIETRDPERIQKFRIICLITVAICVAQLLATIASVGKPARATDLSLRARLILSTMGLLIQIYFFMCIDSLYKNLLDERPSCDNPVVVVQRETPIVTPCYRHSMYGGTGILSQKPTFFNTPM